MNQSCALPLVLLSAGAGFGKTTLLSAWASQSSHPVAWLTLDRLDNDPLRFWSTVLAALRTRHPTVGEAALAQLQAPQPPQLVPLLISLINDLATCGQEIVLILDDGGPSYVRGRAEARTSSSPSPWNRRSHYTSCHQPQSN